jgi:hypothetical protein
VLRRLTVGVLLAGALYPALADGAERRFRCSATTSRQPDSQQVRFRIRCNYEVERVSIRSSKAIASVRRSTRLRDPESGDRIRCARRSSTLVVCRGRAGENVRIEGVYTLRGDPCDGFRTRFNVLGDNRLTTLRTTHRAGCPAS